MTDIVDRKTRSRMMSGIRGKDTKPEVWLRKQLHKKGYRFRKHVRALPGTPDIVLPKYKAVIDVQGCFWHCHKCHLFKWPSTRKEFWEEKLLGNIERDKVNRRKLAELGWRSLIVWECALKGKNRLPEYEIIEFIVVWLKQRMNENVEIKGYDK